MEVVLSEFYPPSAVKDAVLVPNFSNGMDVLAVARGNRLVLYTIDGGLLSDPQCYALYGSIVKLAPIVTSYASLSSLMVILSDFRSCILQFSEDKNELVTLARGNLTTMAGFDITQPQFATHPTVIAAQIGPNTLNMFPIAASATLDLAFPISLGCREIIDFSFVGPTSKVTRLAVLTREFNNTVLLRAIDIEQTEMSFSDDPANRITMPDDARSVIPFESDHQSIVIVFSGQRAIRVAYNAGLTPQVTTATVRTPYPLLKMTALDRNLYIAIEENSLILRAARIEEKGTVHFVNVGTAPEPTAVVPLTRELAFVGSAKEDSVVLCIDANDKQHPVASLFSTIKATGKVTSFLVEKNSVVTLFERAVAETMEMIPFECKMRVECMDCLRHWSFMLKGNSCCLVTNGNESFLLETEDDVKYVENTNTFFRLDQPTLLFSEVGVGTYVQVVDNAVSLFSEQAEIATCELSSISYAAICGFLLVVAAKESLKLYKLENEITLLRTYEVSGMCTAVAVCEKFVAVATSIPNAITWFSIQTGLEVRRVLIDEIVISLVFESSFELLAVPSKGSIHVFGHEENCDIPCEGGHTGLFCLNGKYFICGEIPHLLSGNKATPVKAPNWVSVTTVNEQICGLGTDSLWFGTFGLPEFCSQTYSSQHPICAIYKLGQDYITAQSLKNGIGLFISSAKFPTDELEPFHVFKSGNFVSFASEGDNLFACSSTEIARFVVRHGKAVSAGLKSFGCPVLGFGRFRNYYYYFQYQTTVDFCTIDVTNRNDCAITNWFSINNTVPIDCLTFDNQTAIVIGRDCILRAYSFDQYRECFVPAAHYNPVYGSISHVCVSNSVIVAGTKTGNVFTIERTSCGSVTETELEVVSELSLGDAITVMTASENGVVYIGTELGMACQVKPFSPPKGFSRLYKILAENMSSLGWFSKDMQRYARFGKFYTSQRLVYDMETLRDFLEKSEGEQREILGEGFSLDDARRMVNSVVMC